VKHLYLLVPPDLLSKPETQRELAPLVLSAYQALWHPSLLTRAEALPSCRDLADVPHDSDALLAVPSPCLESATDLVRNDVASSGATILLVNPQHVGSSGPGKLLESLALEKGDENLLLDFFALGFAHLGLQIFFEQMGHENPIDPWALWDAVRLAANYYLANQTESTRDQLGVVFDLLLNHRQTVYPATINLVDLALLPPSCSAAELSARTHWKAPCNLILSGREVDELAQRHRNVIDVVRSAVESGRMELLGGAYDGRPWSLLPFESRCWQLDCSASAFAEHLGRPVDCFAARTMTLVPDLPQLLMKHQYRYALHASFDPARIPHFVDAKLHWTAPDGSVIEALARTARDAGAESDCLRLFAEIARAATTERSATLPLAHWINSAAAWYWWLLRVNEYADVFGRFQTFTDYFLNSSFPDRPTHTRTEEYCSKALELAVNRNEVNPIGRWVCHHRRRARFDALRVLAALSHFAACEPVASLDDLEDRVEGEAAGVDVQLDELEAGSMSRLADLLVADSPRQPGVLVFNPSSFPRRICLELGKIWESPLPIERPVVAYQETTETAAVVVDLPGWGFAWLPRRGRPEVRQPSTAAMAKGRRLRNDHIEVEIDAKTGGIRGIWPVRTGYSRLGQQLVFATGSKMVGRKWSVTASGPAYGEIVSEGELVTGDGGRHLAAFCQRVRVWLGKPIVELHIRLEPRLEPTGDPLQSYFACRWAWPDEKAHVMPACGFVLQTSRVADMEAPELLELRERNLITDILPRGLPFHRRTGYRMADTLLIVPGETAREFEIAVALDMAHRWAAVNESLWPVITRPVENGPPKSGSTGWLAHLNAPNVLCTRVLPASAETGIRLRLIETSGRPTSARLRFSRNPKSARLVNARGELIFDVPSTEDSVPIELAAHEMVEVEVSF
jgi:alpha-mannosidase